MLIAYLFLFILYLGLTLLYAFTEPKPTPIPPWPLLPSPKALTLSAVHCNVDADCASNHVCLTHTCVPKLLKGGKCDSATGQWISFQVKNISFAICTCLNHDLFTQNLFGGDCHLNVGCGNHGQYDPTLPKKCDCEPGYKAVLFADGRFTCQKVPVFEHPTPCGPDELDLSPTTHLVQEGFHPEYRPQYLKSARCVKRPCSFDALSGRPLKQGKFDPNWGCVCDPTYGLFGVVLEGQNKKYLNTEGFDACASLLVKDPQRPISVQLITYFYLGLRDPISLILYDQVPEKDLIPLLRGKKGGPWMIRQSLWRYDYAQYFFKTNPTFRARTRSIAHLGILGMTHVNEFDYNDAFAPKPCDTIPHLLQQQVPIDKRMVYRLLYESPVCHVDQQDAVARPLFKNRVIVNPQQFTFQDPAYEDLSRFNAFVLQYDADVGFERWTLDLAYPYNVPLYRSIATNVPHYP